MSYTDVYFPFLPEWSSGIVLRYGFQTSIFESKAYVEQRSACARFALREMEVKFLNKTPEATKIINALIAKVGSIMLVPIYTECFKTTMTGSLLSLVSITGIDIEHLFNLRVGNVVTGAVANDVGGLVVMDRLSIEAVKAYDIDTLTNTSVLLSEAIADDIDAENALFFPALNCYLESYSSTDISRTLKEFSFIFKEKSSWPIVKQA